MAAHRINASSQPRGCLNKRKRKSTGLQTSQQVSRNRSVKSDKFIHVHHYLNTGRWGAWFNDPTVPKGSEKRRLYFGTYETEYLAARAQDRAALKFKPYAIKPIKRLNFEESDYELDKELRNRLTHEQFRRLLMAESRKCYKKAEPSPCWRKFLAEEEAKGNLATGSGNRYLKQAKTVTSVTQGLTNQNPVANTVAATKAKRESDSPGEEEGQVYTAKRIKRLTHVAPNQSAGGPAGPLVPRRARSLRARPVRKAAPEAARPVCVPRVRPAEGEVRSALRTSEQSSVNPDRLVWERIGGRSVRKRPSSSSAASRDVAVVEPDDLTMLMVVSVLSDVTSGTSDGEDLGSEPLIQNPNTRRRLDIDLNREPESSSTAESPHETDGNLTGDTEELKEYAESLMMLKAGWIMAS